MKSKIVLVSVVLIMMSLQGTGQNVYPVTSGEMIFSQSQSSFTQEFLVQYPNASLAANNVRYTVFFHLGQYLHYDINDRVGFYSGLGVRNVGMITDETLPQTVSLVGTSVPYQDYKIIRRQYMLGIPLAIKLGSFKNHFYIFGGGEYEMAFHLKEKYWNSFERSGSKTKNMEWFSNQTPTFLPSLFGGVQFPGGINIKFKYYMTDFLNTGYKVSNNSIEGTSFDLSDQSRYKESKLFYVSLCWQFNTSELFGYDE